MMVVVVTECGGGGGGGDESVVEVVVMVVEVVWGGGGQGDERKKCVTYVDKISANVWRNPNQQKVKYQFLLSLLPHSLPAMLSVTSSLVTSSLTFPVVIPEDTKEEMTQVQGALANEVGYIILSLLDHFSAYFRVSPTLVPRPLDWVHRMKLCFWDSMTFCISSSLSYWMVVQYINIDVVLLVKLTQTDCIQHMPYLSVCHFWSSLVGGFTFGVCFLPYRESYVKMEEITFSWLRYMHTLFCKILNSLDLKTCYY